MIILVTLGGGYRDDWIKKRDDVFPALAAGVPIAPGQATWKSERRGRAVKGISGRFSFYLICVFLFLSYIAGFIVLGMEGLYPRFYKGENLPEFLIIDETVQDVGVKYYWITSLLKFKFLWIKWPVWLFLLLAPLSFCIVIWVMVFAVMYGLEDTWPVTRGSIFAVAIVLGLGAVIPPILYNIYNERTYECSVKPKYQSIKSITELCSNTRTGMLTKDYYRYLTWGDIFNPPSPPPDYCDKTLCKRDIPSNDTDLGWVLGVSVGSLILFLIISLAAINNYYPGKTTPITLVFATLASLTLGLSVYKWQRDGACVGKYSGVDPRECEQDMGGCQGGDTDQCYQKTNSDNPVDWVVPLSGSIAAIVILLIFGGGRVMDLWTNIGAGGAGKGMIFIIFLWLIALTYGGF